MEIWQIARQVQEECHLAVNKSLESQLSDFVSRGLIVAEVESPQLTEIPGQKYKYEVRTSVKLKLKDQEYIEDLESENEKLRNALTTLELIKREKK